jgi:hypothetical protein
MIEFRKNLVSRTRYIFMYLLPVRVYCPSLSLLRVRYALAIGRAIKY